MEERRKAREARRKPNIGSIPLFKLLDIKGSLCVDTKTKKRSSSQEAIIDIDADEAEIYSKKLPLKVDQSG